MYPLLLINSIRHLSEPDKCLVLSASNDAYQITIRYLQPDYQTHLKQQDFNPMDIMVTVKKKHPSYPGLGITFQTSATTQAFGIELLPDLFISETDIPDLQEGISQAKQTLKELKQILSQYFPGVIQT